MNIVFLRILLFSWLIPWQSDQQAIGDDRMFDNTEPRSRMMMVNGNMYFHAGYNKNITFVSQGQGSIFIGNVDISHLPNLVQVDELSDKVDTLTEKNAQLKTRADNAGRSIMLMANITKTIITATKNISMDVKMLRDWKKERSIKDVRLRKYLNKISKGIKILVEAFKANACDAKPCQGGATCIPRFGKNFFCLCPPHRTGVLCENDLDECATYEGLQACQNNATCENIPNGFLCHCPQGYHGPLCQYQHSSCHRSPGLCGHGHCIEAIEGDLADWRCICETGYKLSGDKQNPTCVDINECENSPCHPGVDCINLPGTFQCSGCPKGYYGNGVQCADVDECNQPEYPCSTNPRAPCLNTVGSYHCGACPPGYRGDGKTCKRFSACSHRPCFPTANCTDDFDNINAGGFTCQCPDGYLGDGIGPAGCKKGNSTICRADGRCLNGGSCKAVTEDSYLCICPEGYFGSRCEKASECIYSPCKNGGTCQYDVGNGYSCLCPPKFYGHDCENEEDSCGEHFTEREGNFTYPDSFFDANNELKTCDFVISPPANNEALRITFTRFNNMENIASGPTDCKVAYGNVSLFDGDNDGANLFSVFCGITSSPKAPLINTPITLTGSRAMLRYKGTKGTWAIKWELKKRDCGYRTSAPSGLLSVPSHYMNISCEWFITAPAQKVIELTIPIVRLGPIERNCSISQLEVYDGYAAYDNHRVIHFCENINNTVTTRTTGPFLSVYFVNDILWGSSNTLPGFQMKYKFVDPDHKCGGELINSNKDFGFGGEITTPNWGGLYPPNTHCTWKIDGINNENDTILSMQSLKLEIMDFDVPSPFMFTFDKGISINSIQSRWGIPRGRRPLFRSLIKCTQDYLHIYADGNLLHDGCNSHRPPPSLIVPEGKAILQFRSDAKQQGKGFKLKYSLVCERSLRGNGTIQTWNFPDGGVKGKCRYVISGNPTDAITLRIKTIGLRVANVKECFFMKNVPDTVEDYVQLIGGREEDKFLNQKYVCPRFPFIEDGEFTVSASRPLIIEYSSSGNQNNKGLSLEYSTVDVGCGGFISQSTGTINSPSYPNKYLPHMHCVYHITVLWTKNVRLTFDNFDLEVVQNDDCSYDRVEIYEHYVSENRHGKLLGKFCGSMLPPAIVSPSFEMAVVFISDRSIAGNGFSARFDSVDAATHCDQTLTARAGNIIFNSTKGRFSECAYHIALPFNSKILIKVESMNLSCQKGRLQIRNGADINSPGFPSLWGQSEICNDHPLQTTLRTHSNRAYLKLILVENKGVSFNISYEQITANCGGRVSGVSGSIAAPQYPQKDSRPIDCEWIVAVAPGNRVNFQLALVDDLRSSDENGFCGIFAANRLDVLDGPQIGARIIRRYCRKVVAAEPVASTDHEIMVKYRQQGGIQFGALFGFLAHFNTDCRDIELTGFSGTIQSPGYPDPVYTNLFCKWKIKVPLGNRIKIIFHKFVMDQMPTYSYHRKVGCNQNWLRFNSGEVAQATVRFAGGTTNITNNLEEVCENIVPSIVMSTGNIIHLTLQSRQKQDNKFWLTWSTIGCGGDIQTEGPIMVNKKNFDANVSIAECFWSIQAPIGTKVQVVLTKFLIFKNGQYNPISKDCIWSDPYFTGLETFAGLSNESDIVQDKLCSPVKETPVNIQSHSNQMFMRMKFMRDSIQTEQDGTFFEAKVNFIVTNPGDQDDCGGILEVPVNGAKTVHSPRFPAEYPKDCRCEWLFKAPPGHHLSFKLLEYTTPNSHPQYELTKTLTMSRINNLTCQHSLQILEGVVTIYEGNTTKSQILDRFCSDIKEPEVVEVDSSDSLVTFQGASAHRVHMSGEEEKKRIGFVLEATAACGGLEYAKSEEQTMQFFDMPKGTCNVTIRKKNPDDAGVVVRLDEYFLKNQISKYNNPMASRDYATDEIYITIDGGEAIRRAISIQALRNFRNPYTHEEFRGENEIKISIFKRTSFLTMQVAIAFHSDYQNCGTMLVGKSGYVSAPKLVEDMECIWTIDNNPGNSVNIVTAVVILPQSENCVESYIEVRVGSDEGKLIERFCDGEARTFSDESLWIKMRFIKPQASDPEADGLIDEETNASKEYGFQFRYQQLGGGTLTVPGFIMQPKYHFGITLEYKIQGEEGKGLVFRMDSVNFPEYGGGAVVGYVPAGLYFVDHSIPFYSIINKMKDLLASGSRNVITGFHPPNELHFSTSKISVYAFGMGDEHYSYTMEWDIVELDDIPNENKTTVEQKVYSCGGLLTPTWEWQSIRSPPAPITPGSTGQNRFGDSGYPPDIHCMWHMTRQRHTGIEVKVVTMDLENVHNCVFDYVAILASDEEYEDIDEAMESAHKMCRRDQEKDHYTYTYNRKVNIHFVTDRNRGGSGFELQYKLTCNSFDFIKKEDGLYSATLTNPGYPNAALAETCGWTVILESNRRILVTIEDIVKGEDDCKDGFLAITQHGSLGTYFNPYRSKFCGRETDAKNVTMKHGRVFMKWTDQEKKHPKGFKVKIEEIMEECSSDELFVDEVTPTRTFKSPQYPQMIPNSLDCDYILRAPSGHRLQFTVDPTEFRLESSAENDTCFCDACDYLEVRDGPTEHSPLIGRYCNVQPPSTITSTGNFLFIKLRTDSFAQSAGFKAEIRMAVCGGTILLPKNKTYLLQSPNYPDVYPMSADCKWDVHSPNSHFIETTLNHIWVSWSINCTNDRLMIFDGNFSAPYLMEPLCSSQRIESIDTRSSSSMLSVQFIANTTVQKTSKVFCKDKKCGFELALKVSDQGCGGVIDDSQGVLLPPGYPDRLLPHVYCRWDFKAGPGYRYLIEFEFTDKTRNGFYQQRYEFTKPFGKTRGCFMDVVFFNGKWATDRPVVLGQHYFCEDETNFMTESDYASIIYSDMATKDQMRYNANAAEDKFYVPFRINYTKVPTFIDDVGCTYKIENNFTIELGIFKNLSSMTTDLHYCHLAIIRPEDYGTMVIKIVNYTDEQSAFPRDCSDWGSYIEFESDDDVRTVTERFCNTTFAGKKTNDILRVYNNKQIDIHVKTHINAWSSTQHQKFTLIIEFQPCGGIVDEPNYGEITSPNYGIGTYGPNQNCLWQLRAPEGMLVWINITNFDVEQHVECGADVLIAGEGKDNSIIHRYCQPDATLNTSFLNPLADRHRSFRTHSRFLTLTWQTNEDIELTGWRIEYEFVDEGDGCGFITHAMNGIVHSPNFPRDYPNDEECIWDIQVPIGYHVVLTFSHFDIEGGTDCQNDMLQISEEHSSRANEPLGEYYYLFEDEEKKAPMCGIATPGPVETTSNRMRLNFTSNSKINAKGFRAEWSAACGAVFRLSHYQIVSPYYPESYPNEDRECLYLIRPEGELEKAIVVLKMQDLDLSPVKFAYGRFPCESDYVEIIDLMNDRVLQTFCGGEEVSEEPIAIQGPVGIKFVTNQTFMHTKLKTNRGFSVTYSMKKCGGNVEMLKDEDMVWPVTSPAFPLEYPHDLDCVWNITTTEDRVLMVKFIKLEIEDTPLCDLDYLEMYDGSEMKNTTKMGTWCGDNKNMPKSIVRTSNNSMVLRFVTDSSMSRGGFKLVVTASLGPKNGCGGKLEAKSDWKELKPPVKADGSYYNNLFCGWTITSPEKTMIEFKLEKMDTEVLQPLPGDPVKNSCVDQLKIYDGYRAFSPLLVDNLCDDTITVLPIYFHSSHRVAHVSFETDVSGVGKGFTLLYRAVAPDCGDWITATGSVQTIDFSSKPKKALRIGQRFQRCQWVINSNDQTPIELNFRNINFTSPENDCTDAFIEIRDVGIVSKCNHPACATHDNEKKILKYCGVVPSVRFISNTMSVQITTAAYTMLDEPSTFTLDYQLLPGCNRTINATEIPAGRITSPNYPNPYNHNDTCITHIEAEPDKRILLVFNTFRLEMGRPVFYSPVNQTGILRQATHSRLTYRIPACDHDYVEIYDEAKKNGTKKFCGSGLPPTYFSSANHLTVELTTDYSVNSEGYDASYYIGNYNQVTRTWNFGMIHDPSGAISNIGYPQGYNDSHKEIFTVAPPPGQACSFMIETLSLAIGPGDNTCEAQEEYLLIEQKNEAGRNVASQRVMKCSHQAPIKFSVDPGDERKMKFTFVADGKTSNDGIGFRISWDCHTSSANLDQ